MGRSHLEDHQKNLIFSIFSKIDQVMVSQVWVLAGSSRSGVPFLEITTLFSPFMAHFQYVTHVKHVKTNPKSTSCCSSWPPLSNNVLMCSKIIWWSSSMKKYLIIITLLWQYARKQYYAGSATIRKRRICMQQQYVNRWWWHARGGATWWCLLDAQASTIYLLSL